MIRRPTSKVRPLNLRKGFHRKYSTVVSALGYRAVWGKIKFYLGVKSLPGVNAKPLFGPNLDVRLYRLAIVTRYYFTSRLVCTNQSSFYCPLPPVLSALLQYYCTSIAQYTTLPPDPPCVYARRMGQPTQRATNYTARSNIDTAQIFLHANGQRPKRASIRQRSRRRQRRGEPHTEHCLGIQYW